MLSGVKLAVIAVAAALLFRDAAPFSLPGGLTLLLILFAFDSSPKTFFQSLAFSAAGGFAFTVAALPIVPRIFGSLQLGFPLVYVVWIVGTLLVLLIDRSRGSSAPVPSPQSDSIATAPAPAVVAVPAAPPPPAVRETPMPGPAEPAPRSEPIVPHLVRNDPPSVFESAPVEAPPLPPPAPLPQAVPLKGGKQTDIYVNLMGEGMVMLRSVKAEHIGRDFYHIIDSMPANERWEFGPGSVVRCQKRNLSSGKALVAFEEAPRAQ